MQRRPASSNPSTALSSGTTRPSRTLSSRRGTAKTRKFNPIFFLVGLALTLLALSWMYFPDQVVKVEHEAERMGQQLAQKARNAETNVQDWVQHHQSQSADSHRSSSEAASAAMQAQPSKWVEGEKKLKKKLTELYELQQKGELLGVPVLTRWLGDDFPAWVTPDMDEAQWRKDVTAKYKQMREEEEQWKKDMQKIIDQREQDMGITTAR